MSNLAFNYIYPHKSDECLCDICVASHECKTISETKKESDGRIAEVTADIELLKGRGHFKNKRLRKMNATLSRSCGHSLCLLDWYPIMHHLLHFQQRNIKGVIHELVCLDLNIVIGKTGNELDKWDKLMFAKS